MAAMDLNAVIQQALVKSGYERLGTAPVSLPARQNPHGFVAFEPGVAPTRA